MSLRSRLMASAASLAVLAIAAVALAARFSARSELYAYAEVERPAAGRLDGERLDALAELSRAPPERLTPGGLEAAARRLGETAALLLVAPGGRLLAAGGAPLERLGSLATEREGDELVVRGGGEREALELRLRGGGLPVTLADGSSASLEVVLLPPPRLERAARAVGRLDRLLVAAGAVAAAGAVLFTWLVGRRLLAPIDELAAATAELAAGRLDRRAAVRGDDELARLGAAFNRMAAELERQERLRRDLTGDVAHELRTPLTAMLCRLEAVRDGLVDDLAGTLASLHGDVVHLSRLVGDLQELALAEAGGLRLERVRTPLAAVVRSAVRAAGLDGDPRLRLELEAAPEVDADPLRLRQILTNLLTNAARHTPASGVLRVVARPDGDATAIEVVDSGEGIAAEQLPWIFERFHRTDPARRRATGGSGLGLAIVKGLVEAHGGRVWVRSRPGEETVFGFALPAARG